MKLTIRWIPFFFLFCSFVFLLNCSSSTARLTNQVEQKGGKTIIEIPPDALPILYESGDHILVPVIIKDSLHTFLIMDNGTKILSFDSLFVANNYHFLKLNYVPRSFIRTQISGGVINQKVVLPIPNISLGYDSANSFNINTNMMLCGVGDYSIVKSDKWHREKYAGILPMHIISDKIYIDLLNQYMRVIDTISIDGYRSISFTIDHMSGLFLSELQLEARTRDTVSTISGIFSIDFGFNRGIILNPTYFTSDDIIYGKGDFGSYQCKISLSGEETLILEECSRDDDGVKLIIESPIIQNCLGVLGLEFLKHFLIIVDYGSKTIYLKDAEQY
jgi:hypothetical protein